MSLLEIQNLTIQHGADALVRDVHLALEKGQTLCVVGESGSGKSLSALSVMGLLPDALQMAGNIVFDGQNLADLAAEDYRKLRGAQMAMIFQEPMTSLNPVLKVGEQIAEVFQVHTKLSAAEIKQEVLSLLEKVRIDDPERRYHAYPSQLSGGQRQRVMIAMAIALKPKLLIADEPTTALDVTVQGEILRLIKDLQKEMGMAVLFITHDFGVVQEMADTVAVMEKGIVVENGTVSDVITNPRHRYTQKLLRAMPLLRLEQQSQLRVQQPLLEAQNITKTFMVKKGGFFGKSVPFQALKGVSFTLNQGESLGIVGESGSGKSTLARCVALLHQPDGGNVLVCGQDVTNAYGSGLRAVHRQMQMVFQDPFSSLNPRMKIGETVGEGVRAHGLLKGAKLRTYVEELLADCGLPADSYDRYPHQFSGGQRQRVCIARALALKPAIIVADEAVSALDVSVQKQILDLMKSLRTKYNLSFLFISHDLRVVSEFCDRVLVMQHGKLVEEGYIADVFGAPKDAYTQQLVAAIPSL